MARSALAVVVFALLLAGCGGDSNSSEGSGTTTTADCESLTGATLGKKLSPAINERETMFLTDVELEVEDCVERVTFKFKKSEPGPGYDVSFRPAEVAKIEDGSGNPLTIAGADFLVVRMFPAMTAEIDGEDVQPTYTGPRSIPAPGEAQMIREVAQTGDFEAQVTWAIGLDGQHPFAVTASNDELVVEISGLPTTS
jgi:hypothetical protein